MGMGAEGSPGSATEMAEPRVSGRKGKSCLASGTTMTKSLQKIFKYPVGELLILC